VVDQEYKWIPDDVITAGGAYLLSEPRWVDLPQMSIMELFHVRRTSSPHASHSQWRPAMHCWQLFGQVRDQARERVSLKLDPAGAPAAGPAGAQLDVALLQQRRGAVEGRDVPGRRPLPAPVLAGLPCARHQGRRQPGAPAARRAPSPRLASSCAGSSEPGCRAWLGAYGRVYIGYRVRVSHMVDARWHRGAHAAPSAAARAKQLVRRELDRHHGLCFSRRARAGPRHPLACGGSVQALHAVAAPASPHLARARRAAARRAAARVRPRRRPARACNARARTASRTTTPTLPTLPCAAGLGEHAVRGRG